jgi:hypothetical protein
MKLLKDYDRFDLIKLLQPNSIGIELGVAEGVFSTKMVESGAFSHFFAVDMYSDRGHDTAQYKKALKSVGILANYKLLRMTFDDALDLFPNHFFDFVYVDGYAHTGEEEGKTIFNWHKKVKKGGILAGDDYCPQKWPLVTQQVNRFRAQFDFELMLTEKVYKNDPWSKFPSWAMQV